MQIKYLKIKFYLIKAVISLLTNRKFPDSRGNPLKYQNMRCNSKEFPYSNPSILYL